MSIERDIPSLQRLISQLQQVPYLASKNLYRVVGYLLELDPQKADQLCHSIIQAKQQITTCDMCGAWQERGCQCLFCADTKRDRSVVCVVQNWQDLSIIEKAGGYTGVYHLLGGVLCPLEGVGPEDLRIEPLCTRVMTGSVTEIILATNQTPEGEATASYIAHKLRDMPVKLSCLARGVPVGSSLEFMDRLTIYKALSERRPF